jgi:hypothetical protein
LTEKSCHADCLKCVDYDKGCLLCIPGFKLIGKTCILPKKMYLNIPGENKLIGSLKLKTIDTKNNYDLSKMNQLTISLTIKINGLVYSSSNKSDYCYEVLTLTLNQNRRVCYMTKDDSLNLMEGSIPAFKFVNFSNYFGKFVVISIALDSKYIYDIESKTYKVDPSVGQYWRNYYAFYVNENPVPAYREFDYENKINTLALYMDKLELGNNIWAYLNEINVYKGFYTNPFTLVTHNTKRANLMKTYSFHTTVQGENKIIKAPAPNSINRQFCLDESIVNFDYYSGINSGFAYLQKYNCVSDFEIKFENACSGDTYFEIDSKTKNCSPCSLSCPTDCAFKGVNGCTANSLESKVFQKYTNYDSSILLSETADINNKYYFSNDIESRRVSLVDISKYSSIKLQEIKVKNSKQYTTEFWFHIYMHGLGSITKSDANKPLSFDKHEVIWDKHNKIVIENVNNEIIVTCYPLYDVIDNTYSIYEKSMINIKSLEK